MDQAVCLDHLEAQVFEIALSLMSAAAVVVVLSGFEWIVI